MNYHFKKKYFFSSAIIKLIRTKSTESLSINHIAVSRKISYTDLFITSFQVEHFISKAGLIQFFIGKSVSLKRIFGFYPKFIFGLHI